MDGRCTRWTSPDGEAGVQFDAFTAQHPSQNLATWNLGRYRFGTAHLGHHRIPVLPGFAVGRFGL